METPVAGRKKFLPWLSGRLHRLGLARLSWAVADLSIWIQRRKAGPGR